MFPLSIVLPDMFVHPLLRSWWIVRQPTRWLRDLPQKRRIAPPPCRSGPCDELPAETVRVRRLRMVMALERVGHGLSDAIPGLEAAQKTSPVIGHPGAYNPDQFRIHWWQGNNQLTYKDNTKKELFHRIVYIFYPITIFGKFFHEIVLLSHRQFTCKIFEYPQNVFF